MKDLRSLSQKLAPLVAFARKYLLFTFFIFLLLVCAFLVFQINKFASVEPSEDAVTSKLQDISRPHIDQSAITKIQQLQDQNVQVKTLFQQARDNPFSE